MKPGIKSDCPIITVAIISDTHAVLDPRIAEVISTADIAVHAGDIGGAGVLSAMKPKTGRIIAIIGNNDLAVPWQDDQPEYFESLPDIAEFELPGGTIAIEHGHRHDYRSPSHQSLRDAHPDSRLIVYGHTHHQVVDRELEPWVVNPGAAGITRNHGGPSCLLLIASEKDWKIESIRFSG